MDREEAATEVERLAREAREQQAIADEALRRVAGLRTIISGWLQVFPDLEVPAETIESEERVDIALQQKTRITNFVDAMRLMNAPKATDAVRQVIQERPDYPWYVSELVSEMRDRGWLPESDNPASTVRAALERLRQSSDSDVRKTYYEGKVAYRYAPDDPREEDNEPF